jgi:hypothetical protein
VRNAVSPPTRPRFPSLPGSVGGGAPSATRGARVGGPVDGGGVVRPPGCPAAVGPHAQEAHDETEHHDVKEAA